MKGLDRSKFTSMLTLVVMLSMLTIPVTLSLAHPHIAYATSTSHHNPFCSRIGTSLWASSGAQMYCFGPQPNGSSQGTSSATAKATGSNVNAANPSEDVIPSGAEAYGQSETSIAAVGPYVVEAWNDATAFFSPCPSPMNKEEGTGYGFSANGGKSFTDEGGLPNTNCQLDILAGDPSVEAWRSGGSAYFYVSSLYFPISSTPSDSRTFVAINACKASGTGTTASISCSQPIIAAASTQCVTQRGNTFCSFIDKEYLSIDPQRGRLYVSYTEFGVNPPPDNLANGQIELAVCDIGTLTGGTGPLGGTAGSPICAPGSTGTPNTPVSPYVIVAPGPTCVNEGAYPAVDVATGDVYVAYEFNILSNLSVPGCATVPIQDVMNYIPSSCLTLPTSSCTGPAASTAINVISLELAQIPGYNRHLPQGPGPQDFPRIAVSDPAGTVSMVWNDARLHPLGDILMQSFALKSLTPIQSAPVRLNSHATGGMHFLPALRNTNQNGTLNVSWYERSSPTTAVTDVVATLSLDPHTTSTPANNTLVTTAPSNWDNVSSNITPNFGDYTDNYVIATPNAPYTGATLYVAWSDGRIGVPQPFEAHLNTH